MTNSEIPSFWVKEDVGSEEERLCLDAFQMGARMLYAVEWSRLPDDYWELCGVIGYDIDSQFTKSSAGVFGDEEDVIVVFCQQHITYLLENPSVNGFMQLAATVAHELAHAILSADEQTAISIKHKILERYEIHARTLSDEDAKKSYKKRRGVTIPYRWRGAPDTILLKALRKRVAESTIL